jgi:alkyl hydroperoxide reductase subunit AhpF
MALLKDQDKQEIRKRLAELEHPVKLLMFTQENECPTCAMTHALVEEVAELSEKLTAEIRDFVVDAGMAQQYGIDKIPAVAVLGDKDYGIRFYGVPGGYEFPAFLDAIRDVGRRDPQLSPDWLALLAKVDRPVHMQVLVTPT